MVRTLAVAALVAVGASGLGGCDTIRYCNGSAPYSEQDVPKLQWDPAPAPDPALVKQAAARVMSGKHEKAHDWSGVGDDLLYRANEVPLPQNWGCQNWIAWDGMEGHRALYVLEWQEMGGVALRGGSSRRTDVYDADTGERLASWGGWDDSFALMIMTDEIVEPERVDGVSAMRRVMAREIDPAAMRYSVKHIQSYILGAFGAGWANHRNYIEVLWIPIPTGARHA